jgi:hypothetical protein
VGKRVELTAEFAENAEKKPKSNLCGLRGLVDWKNGG